MKGVRKGLISFKFAAFCSSLSSPQHLGKLHKPQNLKLCVAGLVQSVLEILLNYLMMDPWIPVLYNFVEKIIALLSFRIDIGQGLRAFGP